MAVNQTRRAALGALVVGSAAVACGAAATALAAAPANELAVWKRELRAFRKIEAAHDAFDRDFWTPAYEADKAAEAAAGNPWPGVDAGPEAIAVYHAKKPTISLPPSAITDEIDAEMERHQEAYLSAMDRLIEEVPAPNCAAVLLKLEWAIKRSEDFEGLFDDHREAILSDLRRLAAREG
jgi:hypothetical protein